MAGGSFLFYTRQGFKAVGGFDPRFFGSEELVLGETLKERGRFIVLRESAIHMKYCGRPSTANSSAMLLGSPPPQADRFQA